MVVWFITGCSSGFGSEVTRAALARGDKVIATARNASKLKHLADLGALTLSLDVTAPDAEIKKVVDEALKTYGYIDILFNNAGQILEGAVEEISDEEAKAQFNTNFFGSLAVTRAVLPHMRARKSGTIAMMGSIGGWASSVGYGVYSATKFALVAVTESLAEENAHLGIRATIVEPGYFRTKLLGSGNKVTAGKVIDDLRPAMDPLREAFAAIDGNQPGDPVKGARVIVDALTASGTCEGRTLPKRLALGEDAVIYIGGVIERHRKELDEWKDVAATTNCDD